jgi:hypothetical protein
LIDSDDDSDDDNVAGLAKTSILTHCADLIQVKKQVLRHVLAALILTGCRRDGNEGLMKTVCEACSIMMAGPGKSISGCA